ncbi:MAG: AI-2E family transporter [Deltaproteobacteria bacterium]|nr:AI-2E family transporter [Deltaproteobacteria bacterium]
MKFDTKAILLFILSLVSLASVLYLGALMFYTFLNPLVWAGLISFVLWPLQKKMVEQLRFPSICAAIIVAMIFVAVITIVAPASFKLAQEVANILEFLSDSDKVRELFNRLKNTKVISNYVPTSIVNIAQANLEEGTQRLREFLVSFVAGFGKTALSSSIAFLFFLLFTFFILRDAPNVVAELSKGLKFLSGTKFEQLWQALRESLRSALIGGVITATIQGSLAGVGYFLAGAPYPLLFTILTIIAGTIPFTPPLVFTPVALYVMFAQDFTAGTILMVYCWTIVNVSDPLIRPILVGRGIKMPTGLMFIGVLGGVANFGLMGIFVGPVIMAILRVFWLEFFKSETKIDLHLSQTSFG